MEQLLKKHLGDCKHSTSSNCSIPSSYQIIDIPQFYVYDAEDGRPVTIVPQNQEYQLTVKNPEATDICFVKTDKCLFNDETKKCDCILYNTGKFFLVEIKSSSSGGRSSKRKKAVEQLADTINLLKDNGIDLDAYETKAIICFKRQDTHPVRASANSQKAIFLEQYNVSLEEGNVIEF